MLTELCLGSDEFDHFAVQNDKSITFCLKELRVRQRVKTRIKKTIGMEHNWGVLESNFHPFSCRVC